MGVSRSPIREALHALSRGGLIVIEPRRGAFVAELDRNNAAELYVCRLLLEPTCAGLAVQHMDDRREQRLTAIFQRMQSAANEGDASAYILALKDYKLELARCLPQPAAVPIRRIVLAGVAQILGSSAPQLA